MCLVCQEARKLAEAVVWLLSCCLVAKLLLVGGCFELLQAYFEDTAKSSGISNMTFGSGEETLISVLTGRCCCTLKVLTISERAQL
jgi:hypothetical protein